MLTDYLKVALTELKSAQKIIRILHDERVEQNNLKNQVNLSNATNRKPDDVRFSKMKKTTKDNHNSNYVDKVKHKIRIVGDSHARGLANELKYNLTLEFNSQGVVKPGSSLEQLVNISDTDMKNLTMSDVCVVWGGSMDVGRNETKLGIRALKEFVSSLNHTNVVVINVPYRHDLAPNSCVNCEVQLFNRRLEKLKRAYSNLSVVTVDSTRELFTRQGYHLNSQGKEHIARRVASVIKDLFSANDSKPIVLKWSYLDEMQSHLNEKQTSGVEVVEGNGCGRNTMEQLVGDGAIESNVANHATILLMSQENTCLNQVGVHDNPSSDHSVDEQRIARVAEQTAPPGTPSRKIPTARNKDFLWE
ncbi:hypothetical protein B7P43_G12753 [Cryptotermes secundus]|uniref:Uncharacterized protein n=1 Tax=Cryptotermes secundus TaxID=105785 RepID=A0A2J7R5C7_9NEOP|nr:hypothetical protein B7P43_G12753 [Cryptotermes secundus]